MSGPEPQGPDLPPEERLHRQLEAIWRTPPGLGRLAAVNHNIVGLRFILTALGFFALGGLLAMAIRVQLASAESRFLDAESYAQVFTMHGTIMMFLFAIPLIEGMALYLLPKLLGARDLAFPRLSAFGYWCYLFGGLILLATLAAGVAPAGGWFMYPPLSGAVHSPGINADAWLLGVTFVEISAIAAAVEIVVTILMVRAPGMSLARMPIFAWYLLTVAAMMLIGFPPLILGSILLEVERAFGWPYFDPARGGDPVLWQHLFWLFGHPEVYIIFLPAAGAVSTLVPVFAGRPLAAYPAVIAAVVAMAFLSFGLWVHHMYAIGLPHLSLAFFSAASALVAVPTAVQVFAWIATLAEGGAAGRLRGGVPMLYVAGFLCVFVAGGLTGVMLAMVPFDLQAHDTHFVVAHLHYVLVGGFLFPMIGALYYWLPLASGRLADPLLARLGFWLLFIGFNGTFLQMHLTGLLGMPRRYASYPDVAGWEALNLSSSLGSFVMAAGLAVILVDLVLSVRHGVPLRAAPWPAGTLDWAVGRFPPPAYNFAAQPLVTRRADSLDPEALRPALTRGEGYLSRPRHGWQETLLVEPVTGAPAAILILPRPGFVPLWAALATGGAVLCLLAKAYALLPLFVLLLIAALLRWSADAAPGRDTGPQESGGPEGALPVHSEIPRPPVWWGVALLLAADATLFASLLFGGLFLWLSPAALPLPPAELPLPLAAGLAVLGLGAALAGRRACHGGALWLWLTAAAQALVLAGLALAALAMPDPRAQALAAVGGAVLAYGALHAGVGLILAGAAIWHGRRGRLTAVQRAPVTVSRLWQDYTAAVLWIALAYLLALPALAGAPP